MLNSLYCCPVCRTPLTKDQNTWQCQNHHSFDCHKKGYVNLLLAQNKRSKAPGDDQDMIISRRRFLEAGHYEPLASAIAKRLSQTNAASILDAGCGEGYYTAEIANALPESNIYGLDISKPAIHAASVHKGVEWCVASSTQAPYVDGAFDAIVSVFSRVESDSFYRLLKPAGIVLMAAPDHDHLLGLRGLIYQDVRPYDTSKHSSYFDQRFTLLEQTRIEVPFTLSNNQALMDLLGMTPHAHRLASSTRTKLEQTQQLTDKACFQLYCFQKQS